MPFHPFQSGGNPRLSPFRRPFRPEPLTPSASEARAISDRPAVFRRHAKMLMVLRLVFRPNLAKSAENGHS
jgi:hypothetical protein